MNYVSNITRPQGDPRVIESGPGSLDALDRLGRALGWFSIGLGLFELIMPRRLTHQFGMEGKEGVVRAYGLREIGSGLLSLSIDKGAGLWSRVAGDGLDIATLSAARRPGSANPGLKLAMAAVLGILVLDVIAARGVGQRHSREGSPRRYSDRSGFPHGIEKARGAAADFARKVSGAGKKSAQSAA